MNMKKRQEEEAHNERFRKTRSKIIYEITMLIVVVVFASGIATFFLVRASQDRLIEKSKDKLVETEVGNISSSFNYIVAMQTPEIMEKAQGVGMSEYAVAFAQKRVTEAQEFVSDVISELIASGALGLETNLLIINEWQMITTSFLFASSDKSLIYNWDVPTYISDAIDEGTPYILREQGIPELGLEGEYLIVIKRLEDPKLGYVAGFVGIKPMRDELAAIGSFYSSEKGSLSLILASVIGGSLIVVIILSFFVLNYLIRKRIIEPIDELSAAAEQVMEGNLDVDIEVHAGEEFEGLKWAFREMVESFRAFMAKAVGET
jgi:methyl-accepting chemotaxis protein